MNQPYQAPPFCMVPIAWRNPLLLNHGFLGVLNIGGKRLIASPVHPHHVHPILLCGINYQKHLPSRDEPPPISVTEAALAAKAQTLMGDEGANCLSHLCFQEILFSTSMDLNVKFGYVMICCFVSVCVPFCIVALSCSALSAVFYRVLKRAFLI